MLNKFSRKVKKGTFKQSRFSPINLAVFTLIFVGIGGYVVFRSFAAESDTANIWVDTNGGTCVRQASQTAYSDAAACASFDAAYKKASPGDLVLIKGGSYPSQTINAKSTTAPNIVIKEEPGGRVIVGDAGDTGSCVGFEGATYVEVHGIETTYTTASNGDLHQCGIGIGRGGAHHVVLDSVDSGPAWVGAHDVTVLNSDLGPGVAGHAVGNGSETTIAVADRNTGEPSKRVLFEGNRIHSTSNVGSAHAQCSAPWTGQNITFRNNTFDNCLTFHWWNVGESDQVGVKALGPYLIEGNTFTQSNSSKYGCTGQQIKFGDHGGTLSGIVFRNNRILNSCIGVSAYQGMEGGIGDITIINNELGRSLSIQGQTCMGSSVTVQQAGTSYTCGGNFITGSSPAPPVPSPPPTPPTPPPTPPPPPSDTTAPTVSVIAPASGATVTGNNVTVSASASDNVGVAGVQFKMDGFDQGAEDTSSPYSTTWDTTTLADGTHTLSAVARDASGNTATATSITVTVDNSTPPPSDTTAPTTPANLSSPSKTTTSISLSWNASTDSGGSGFKHYNIYKNNTYLTSTTLTSYSDSGLSANTAYSYKLEAEDNASNKSAQTAALSVTTNANPPTVSLNASPATVTSGSSSTLTWSSTNATTCTASGTWSGSKATSGSQSSGNLSATSTFTLTCTGPGGSASASRSVTVSAPTPSPSPTPPPVTPPTPPPTTPTPPSPSPSTPKGKRADLNGDNSVNIFDLSILLTRYNSNNATADVDKNGQVNIFDLSILLSDYGR